MKKVSPISKNANFYTHLHSGYTSRFFHEYLKIDSEYEMMTSGHHLQIENEFAKLIKIADRIASAIDRNDEKSDTIDNNQSGVFQRVRMSSILGEIDFGKDRKTGIYDLAPLELMKYPREDTTLKDKASSVEEYNDLFNKFVTEIKNDLYFTGKIDKYCYDRMYALLNKYTVSIPASTYEGNTTYVSLFDHLKLTSAISSCLFLADDVEKKFNMLEFDVSGIQKFIFKITEGKDTKRDISKALRGRSLFVSLITDIITYSYLNEFELTQSNIIFNTGGGAMLLLPNTSDYQEKIEKVNLNIKKALFNMFHTDITYVYASVECDNKELELFKIEKAIELKEKLEEAKSKKFSSIITENLFYTKTDKQFVCKMCNSNLVDEEDHLCSACTMIHEISNYFVKHDDMYFVFDFNDRLTDILSENIHFSVGQNNIYCISEKEYPKVLGKYDYIATLNKTKLGYTRMIANLAPLKNNQLLSFEKIAEELIDDSFGDKKLGVLKMDVDNLGAIFAFGLGETRSLSKFLTLSRLMEMFFSLNLTEICKTVSKQLNTNIENIVDNNSMFYINYAGGDDLVVIGPVAGILILAQEIHNKFNKFTLNSNLTISAGIHIQGPKEPIRFGIQAAEENLEKSKSMLGKNSITLVNTTCKFDEYGLILEKVNHYKKMIDEQKISRSTFYNYMTILDIDNFENFYGLVPKLLYSLKRNVKDNTVRSLLVKEISTIKEIPALRKLVLEMKLAIMQTRR